MAEVDARKAARDFVESFRKVWEEFTGRVPVLAGIERLSGNSLSCSGVASLVTFTGRFRGRLLILLSEGAARGLHAAVLGEEKEAVDEEVLLSCMELANIVGGNGISELNDRFRGADLRLAPPSAFVSDSLSLTNFGMSVFNVLVKDEGETIRLNLAIREEAGA
jgi:chemotaxis protein CheX